MTRKAEIQKAREIDTKIAAAWDLYWDALLPIKRLETQLKEAKRLVKFYTGRNSGQMIHFQNKVLHLEATITETHEAAAPLAEAARQMDKDLYEGWSRFFLVKHIHSNQRCSSFRPTTRIGWLPNVSGLTEVEAVKEHGETLCTICFPSAPTELTTKAADPAICAGSGKFRSTELKTGRENAYYSPSGYCTECGTVQTVSKLGTARKHKNPNF